MLTEEQIEFLESMKEELAEDLQSEVQLWEQIEYDRELSERVFQSQARSLFLPKSPKLLLLGHFQKCEMLD